jgi:hypothetical protein
MYTVKNAGIPCTATSIDVSFLKFFLFPVVYFCYNFPKKKICKSRRTRRKYVLSRKKSSSVFREKPSGRIEMHETGVIGQALVMCMYYVRKHSKLLFILNKYSSSIF